MKARLPLLAMMALLALALFAPAAIAQDDDYDDDDGGGTATATATATAGADDDDDDDGAVGGAAALPSTGGPALVPLLAGALLLGSGVVAGVFGLRRDS